MMTNKAALSLKSKKYILWGLFFHLAAVIFSIGFYAHDEQRQVLQMVGYKLSLFDKSFLDFQYQAQIRSWLHPMMYVGIGQLYAFFTKINPFHLALLFRFFSSSLGLLSIWILYKTFESEIGEIADQENYFLFSSFAWFIPFIHARTSNENMCFSFFVFGLYFLRREFSFKNNFWAGVLLAISFSIRFQMALMIIPTLMWMIIDGKNGRAKMIMQFSCGFLTLSCLNLFLDYYFYGNLTFTPYNYIVVNFFQHYLNQFGTSPWYDYLKEGGKSGIPPIGLFFIVIILFFWFKRPKSLLTVMTLPYFFIHSLIGHKEIRFIFPLILFIPLFLTFILQLANRSLKRKIIVFFLVFNVPLIFYISFIPASNLTSFYRHLYYKEKLVDQIFVFAPYEDYLKFYRKVDIEYKLIKENDIQEILKRNSYSYFIATSTEQKNMLLGNPRCHIDYSLAPQWIYELRFIKENKKFKKWNFIECL